MVQITAEQIKSFRLKKRWTQAQAAKKLRVSLRTLVSIESGKYDARPLTLARIAFAMESIERAA